jgi:Holliday junction resolvase
MTRINSKKKGGKNERDLAHVFKQWTGYEFARVPQSGGLRWRRTLDTTGDLMVADEKHILEFPLSIETKFHKEIDNWKILLGQESKLDEFWNQAVADARRGKKVPIVFFRYNGLKKGLWFVMISYRVYKILKSLIYFENGFFNFNNEFVIFTSNCLFEVPYEEFYKKIKPYQKALYEDSKRDN